VVLVGVLLLQCYICLEKQKPNIFGKCSVSNQTVAAVQPRNKIPYPSTRIQTVQDQKKCIVHYKFFPPKQSNTLSSIARTFMAACPLKRAKYLPSKWNLHHDIAHFDTELSIKPIFCQW
jgi:hypothetical protein